MSWKPANKDIEKYIKSNDSLRIKVQKLEKEKEELSKELEKV